MQRTTILALSILSLGLLPLACTQDFNFFASSQGTGGTGASTGSTTQSSTSSGNTGGSDAGPSCMGAMACTAPTDCGAPANDCVTNTCTNGCCGTADVPMATACHSGGGNVCDGQGNCIPCLQATDCPATGTVCATPTCASNACGQTLATKGTACTDNGGTVCDGTGMCIADHCTDGTKDADETDIDCGGAACTPCADGLHCKTGSDCLDKVCTGGGPNKTCQAPTCADGQQNGQETDVDCGGATCDGQGKKCNVGQGCVGNGDCTSDNCQNKVCTLPADGATCTNNNQCASGHCVAGICCNSACTGTCMACTNALTGMVTGQCNDITAGKPAPTGQCTAATCGNTGNCNAGACEQVASGSMCGTTTCMNGTLTAAGMCGSGTCQAGATSSCGAYTCNGNACRTTCTMTFQCATGNFCNAGGACVPKLAAGAACPGGGGQCASSFCVDGVCCNAACTGTCVACTAALTNGADGTCGSVKDGTDPHNTCAVQSPLVCGNIGGSCTAGACTEEPNTFACGGTCTDGATTSSATAAGTCSGTGTCGGAVTSCGNYKCGGATCKTTCATGADCQTGHTCNGSGMCI